MAKAVSQFRKVGRVQCLVHCLTHVSLWTLSDDRPADAASLLGAVHTLREGHLGGKGPDFELRNETAMERARHALGAEEFERSLWEGSASDASRAIDLAETILR